ncbi:MAG: hypothetical protein L0Y42_12325 [Phycisphaerales bacterium]|nr:hypothetical protein [Phycisphaerales bacterium]
MADEVVVQNVRRRRKWPFVAGAIPALLLLLLLLAPTLISLGLGQGIIRRAIDKQINGSVAIDNLSVGWFSDQSIQGLTITDPDGRQAAKLDISIDSGLLNLLVSKSGPANIHVSGVLDGQVREDGSVTFTDLIESKPPSTPAEPLQFPDLPPTTIHLANLRINLANIATGQTLSLDNLTGKLSFAEPAQPITVELHGTTKTDGTPGSIDLTGQASNLFDQQRMLTLRGATATLDLKAQAIPLPLAKTPAQLQSLTMNIASDDLTGRIVVSLDADGQMNGRPPTHLQTQAAFSNVLDGKGQLSLRGGSAHINVELNDAPILAQEVHGSIPSLAATLTSDDLTGQIDLGFEGQTQVEGFEPSPLRGRLTTHQLLSPNGDVEFALDRITGNVSGKAIPTAVLQPLLNDRTPIIASRDIGPTIDIDATFSGATASERSESAVPPAERPPAPRHVTLAAIGSKARLEITATVDQTDQSIRGSHLLLQTPSAHPSIIERYASLKVDRPTDLDIVLTSFTLPPKDPATGRWPLAQYAATGTLKANGPTDILLPAGQSKDAESVGSNSRPPDRAIAMMVQNVNLKIDSPRLADSLAVSGSASIDGANLTIDQKITNLFDASGTLSPAGALPVGTLRITGIPHTTLEKFAPDKEDLVDAVIGNSLDATVTTTSDGSALSAHVQANAAAGLDVQLFAAKTSDRLTIDGATITLPLTPELAERLQPNSEKPINLLEPSTAIINFQQVELVAGDSPFKYALADQPITAALMIDQAVVSNLVADPVTVQNVVAELTSAREGSYHAYSAIGDATIRTADAQTLITHTRYDFKHRTKTEEGVEKTLDELRLELAGLSMEQFEQALGKPLGAVSQWTGDQGGIRIFAHGEKGGLYSGQAEVAFEYLKGNFSGSSNGEIVELAGETFESMLSRQTLEQRMNPTPSGQSGRSQDPPGASPRIRVASDVPFGLKIQRMRLPLAMLRDQPFDPAQAVLDLTSTAGPLTIVNPNDVSTKLTDIKLSLASGNLNEGLSLALTGRADSSIADESASTAEGKPPATRPEPGTLDVNGKLLNLVNQDSKLDLQAAKLQLTAKAAAMPTAVADAFMNMRGLLVAAVGPQMDATFTADDFSPSTGTLDADVQANHGWLKASIKGTEEALRITKNNPLKAELEVTPPLRERLLYKIHPILADIRTTEQPVRIEVPVAAARRHPKTDEFDVSKLRADIEMTVGKVELDSGSTTLSLLRFFGQDGGRQTIPGEIEPISAKIRNGVVTYDRFAVHIDQYTLHYSGEVNLVEQTVSLRTEIPLQALGQSIRELEPFADKIAIPLLTHGKFGNLKTEIDPTFDIGKAALDAGFRGGLDQLLQGEGGLFERMFKDRQPKKPKKDQP